MRNRFESFAVSVMELGRQVQKIKELEMEGLGLKASHTMCLYCLGQHPEGLTATQLVERCREDKAAISRCLNQLMERGLVVRQTPEKQRAYRCRHFLTPEGIQLVEKMNARIQAALSTGGNGLTAEQRENFYQAMDLIRENLAGYLKEKEKEE